MDWLTVVIGLGVCLITAVILYLISVYSFKEHTFEEAIAEQQKFASSLLKGEKGNVKEKEKKPKKSTKKTKDKEKKDVEPTIVAPSVAVEGKPHVEFEPDEEIITEDPVPTQAEDEKKKTDKKEKVKPILKNPDSSTLTNEPFDPDVDTINHFTELVPKDDVELKGKDKDGKITKNKGPKTVEEKIPVEVPVVEPIATKEVAFLVGRNTATQPQQHGTPKKQQRKKGPKSDALDTVDGGDELLLLLGGTEKLLSALRRLPLSVAELQTLIEVLLNRQQEASETFESDWMERSGRLDPIAALRKQLTDKDKMLLEEIEEKQSYQNKLRSLGTEIAAERTRAGQARNQLEEALNRQTSEIAGLNLRIQQLVEHHTNELVVAKNNLQVQKASLSEEHLRQIQRLQEEKGQMEVRYAAIQQDFNSRIQQLEDVMRLKDQHLEELMRHKEQFMEQEVKLQNQLALVQVQLQESGQVRSAMLLESEQNLQAHQEVVQLREALVQQEAQFRQATVESLSRLEELERTKQLLEDRITTSDRELLVARNIASQKEAELQLEVERTTQENRQLMEQLAEANAQQTDQPFDDVTIEALMMKNEDALQAERAIAAEKESQLNIVIERLENDNKTLAEQLSVAQTELADQVKSLTANNEAALEAERAIASEKESQLTSSIERLENDNKTLAEQLSVAQTELADQVKSLTVNNETALEAERAIASEKESQLTSTIQRLENDNKTLAEQLSVAQTELADQVKSLTVNNEAALEAERAIASEKESQLTSSIERLENDNKTLAEQLSVAQTELADQAKSLTANNETALEAERAIASEKESQLTSSIERLENDNKTLAEQLSVAQTELADQVKSLTVNNETALEAERAIASEKESQLTSSIQRLENDNKTLAEQLSVAQTELADQVKSLTVNNEAALEAERTIALEKESQLTSSIERLENDNKTLAEQLSVAQTELADQVKSLTVNYEAALEAERAIASEKESQLTSSIERLQDDNKTLAEQLSVAQTELADQVKSLTANNEAALEAERAIASEKESQLTSSIERLENDNKTLAEQLSVAQTELADQVKSLTANNEAALKAERAIASEKESQLTSSIERLQDDNKTLAEQLSASQTEQVEHASLQTVLEQERAIAAQKESDFQSELQRLRDENQELAQKLSSLPEIQENHQEDRLEVLLKEKDEELEMMKTKNNELRDKNYKVMDALAETEKALVLSKQSANDVSDVQQSIGARLLQVFPGMTFDVTAPPSSFAVDIANQAALSLKKLQEDEQSKAQAQVLRYKTVLSQTEELLNLLQSRVEAEEQSWKSKMAQLECELASTKQEGQFWMEQCRKQATEESTEQTTQQVAEQSEQQSTEVASLLSQLDTLQKKKEEMEKSQLEKTSELENSQRMLAAAEGMVAREKEAAQLLREQLDAAKAEMAAAKVGSIGFMMGWAKGHNSAATVAAATIKNNNANLEKLTSDQSSIQAAVPSKVASTNGNGNSTEEAASRYGV